MVAFSNPTLVVDQDTSSTEVYIERNSTDGIWYDFTFYVFVMTDGGAQGATLISEAKKLMSPCKSDTLAYKKSSSFVSGSIIDQTTYTITAFEEVSSFNCNNTITYAI